MTSNSMKILPIILRLVVVITTVDAEIAFSSTGNLCLKIGYRLSDNLIDLLRSFTAALQNMHLTNYFSNKNVLCHYVIVIL